MKKNLTRLWCEWDIGQDEVIFTDPDTAKAWFNKVMPEIHDNWREDYNFPNADENNAFDAFFDERLVGCHLLTLDP